MENMKDKWFKEKADVNNEKLEKVTGGDLLGNATMRCSECGFTIHWGGWNYPGVYECSQCHKMALVKID